MNKVLAKNETSRPVSWCISGFQDENEKTDLEQGPQLPRSLLVRSTSFQALHSALARLYRIDDFSLEGIGQGFFSDVYKARHRVTGEIMVLKMNKLFSNRHNMLREVELMNRLNHPNILSYFGVCVHEGQLHALTEYIDGGTLDTLIQNQKKELPWTTRVTLALDISKGMDYLHCKNVFHRDLTSKNILIKLPNASQHIRAVVADFGLAATIPQNNCLRLQQVGSPFWMAPEMIRGEWYNHRVDVFSFGIVVCETIARCDADPDVLPRTNSFGIHYLAFSHMVPQDCPPFFLETAFQCCQIEPDSRPSFCELSKKLERILQSLNVASEQRQRKQKVLHRRSFSDESLKLLKNTSPESNAPVRIISNLEVAIGSPQEVLERISAADPYFQPSSATVNPFNQVKLPAKSQLLLDEGGRCCHSMPDLRKLHLYEPSLALPSMCQLASSDNNLSQATSNCLCHQTSNNDNFSSYQTVRRKPKSSICKCDTNICTKSNRNNCRLGVFLREAQPRLVSKESASGTSPRLDTGGGSCMNLKRRGSGESGFFSVEDMERVTTPEPCLSFSELSSGSVVSDEDYFASHMLLQRSSSVITDSSEDLSSLGCCYDSDDDRTTRFNEYATDIKSIVEFFERGYGSIRTPCNDERSRRSVMPHHKEKLVPQLRNKFTSTSRSLYANGNAQHKLLSVKAQASSSKQFNTKDISVPRQTYRQPKSEKKDVAKVKDRPKVYITEGTVRAKRNIFESK